MFLFKVDIIFFFNWSWPRHVINVNIIQWSQWDDCSRMSTWWSTKGKTTTKMKPTDLLPARQVRWSHQQQFPHLPKHRLPATWATWAASHWNFVVCQETAQHSTSQLWHCSVIVQVVPKLGPAFSGHYKRTFIITFSPSVKLQKMTRCDISWTRDSK